MKKMVKVISIEHLVIECQPCSAFSASHPTAQNTTQPHFLDCFELVVVKLNSRH